MLLRFADRQLIPDPEWLSIEPGLLALLADEKFNDIQSTLIEFLARSRSAASQAALVALVRENSAGTISFGFRQRAALLDALPALQTAAADAVALRIAKRSAAEASELAGTAYAPNDAIVQSTYLRLLAQLPMYD